MRTETAEALMRDLRCHFEMGQFALGGRAEGGGNVSVPSLLPWVGVRCSKPDANVLQGEHQALMVLVWLLVHV